MSAITVSLYARLGNQMFQYAHARAYAEQNGHELRTQEWVGEKIFTLDGHNCARPDGTEVETLQGYFQDQKSLIYTRADCRRWFKFRPEIIDSLIGCYSYFPYAHFRRGDYAQSGFPLISRQSVDAAVAEHLFPSELRENMVPGCEYISVSEEVPHLVPAFTGGMSMVPDFYRLAHAPVLFRANSSFSYWAAVLGHGKVFSPIVDGLIGGVENDNVPYVPGNHARLAMHEFTTDLHLKEI